MSSGARQLDLRTTAFEKRVEGLTGQLERLGDVVSKLQQDTANQHGQLINGLREATSSTRVLAETTGHLREALASPKARGQWGERMADRSEEHTSELQSLMRTSYAVFCLK